MRRPRLSAFSSDAGGDAAPEFRLDFDCGLSYIGTDIDSRPLPRLPIYVARPGDVETIPPIGIQPVLDTGAAHTAFDGAIVEYWGWDTEDISARAEDTFPISGLWVNGQPLVGHLHRLTCLIPLGRRFASLRLRVLITPPHTLSAPVLGRRDFFRQVDLGLVEAEQRFYLRFRNRSVLHDAW
jgi:hypothetical protein